MSRYGKDPRPPGRMVFKRGVARTLLVGGVISLILMGMGLADASEDLGIIIGVYGVPGIVMSLTGLLWLRRIAQREQEGHLRYEEKAVLEVAAANDGFASIAMVTLRTALSVADAEAALSRLCQRGVAQPEIMDDGTVTYRFGGLLAK